MSLTTFLCMAVSGASAGQRVRASNVSLAFLFVSVALAACSNHKFEEGHKDNNAVLARLETWEIKISFAHNGKTLDTFYTRRSDSDEYLRAFYLWSPDANRVVCLVCSRYGETQAAFDYRRGSEFQLSPDTSHAAAIELNTLARLECANTESLAFCLCNAARSRWDLEPNFTLALLARSE